MGMNENKPNFSKKEDPSKDLEPINKEELNVPDFSSGIEFENLSPELKEKKITERERNWVFNQLVETKLYDSFIDSFEKHGFSQEEISEFDNVVKNLSLEEYDALISHPHELKERGVPYGIKMIRSGKMTMEKFVRDIVQYNLKIGRRVAYHTSDKNILPVRKNDKETGEWVVYGTERDHRDDDNYMAYYSFDYVNLYRKKNPDHIYAISIQTKGRFGHRKDYTGEWGRAPSLTVIDHFNVKELDQEVNEMMEKIKQSKNKKKE